MWVRLSAEEGYLSDFWEILPEKVKDVAPEASSLPQAVGVKAIWTEFLDMVSGASEELTPLFLLLGGLCLLAWLSGWGAGRVSKVATAVCALFCTALCEALLPFLLGALDVIDQSADFFSAAFPILCAVCACGGGTGRAAVQALGAEGTVGLLHRLTKDVGTPLLSFGLAVSLLSCFGDTSVQTLRRKVQTVSVRILTWVSVLAGAALAMQTVLANASDSFAIRTAKAAASNLLPIVGGAVSGAMSTLSASLSYIHQTVGIGSVFALLLLMLPPLLRLLLIRGALDVCADLTADAIPGASTCFRSFSEVTGGILSLLSVCGVCMIFEITLSLQCGIALAKG